jgi:hypothetical protein
MANGTSVRVGASGNQRPSLVNQPKRGGITPTMVCWRPLRRSVRPTAAGLPSNSRSHRRWLITTTGSASPPARMSDGWMVRPSSGGTPRKLKAFGVTSTPLRLSGANSPVSSAGWKLVAITDAKAGDAWSWRTSSTV